MATNAGAHKVVLNDEPVLLPTNYCPVCRNPPAMADLPSPLKSPTLT
jgi:hypothetical protein